MAPILSARGSVLFLAATCALVRGGAGGAAESAPGAPGGLKNVLLVVVDDLRPQLGAYGLPFMHTPHLDALAAEGVLFETAYTQQSICSPSRNSFMSGRYPAKTKTWNFINSFRDPGAGANWGALPECVRRPTSFRA